MQGLLQESFVQGLLAAHLPAEDTLHVVLVQFSPAKVETTHAMFAIRFRLSNALIVVDRFVASSTNWLLLLRRLNTNQVSEQSHDTAKHDDGEDDYLEAGGTQIITVIRNDLSAECKSECSSDDTSEEYQDDLVESQLQLALLEG